MSSIINLKDRLKDIGDKTTITLSNYIQLLKGSGSFVIPDYQRGYVWGQRRKNLQSDSIYFLINSLKESYKHKSDIFLLKNGGYPPTQNGDIRSLFWLFSLMALQKLVISVGFCTFYVAFWAHGGSFQLKAHACVHQPVEDGVFWVG